MASVRLLSWLLVASSSHLAAAMSVRWDGPLSRSRRAVAWGGLAAAACSRLPACPASAQNLIPPGPYREEDYYGVLLSAWPGGGPAVPDSEKSDFLVEELERKYLLSPADLSGVTLPAALRGQRDVVLIFHGRGGEDRETDALRAAVLASDAAAGLARAVLCFNWEQWIDQDPTRLSRVAQDVGARLGRALAAEAPQLRSLHVVGTSAGGFVANQCVSDYVEASKGLQRARVRLSLTDSFTAGPPDSDGPLRGLDGFASIDASTIAAARRAELFGRDADFAEHFVNTDDPVPYTSTPLPLCYCYDVTAAAERASFPLPGGGRTGSIPKDLLLRALGYHNWPMAYMAQHFTTELNEKGAVRMPSHDLLPRGAVVQVT